MFISELKLTGNLQFINPLPRLLKLLDTQAAIYLFRRGATFCVMSEWVLLSKLCCLLKDKDLDLDFTNISICVCLCVSNGFTCLVCVCVLCLCVSEGY